jgi:predicted dinucleotide-binding enzyme
MKIGVLGTGMVGRALAGAFASRGHEVAIGTRDPDALLARREPDERGNPSFSDWYAANSGVGLGTFAAVAGDSEVIFNATSGAVSLAVLTSAGAGNLEGKVVVDVANPLDFSGGFPPSLSVCNTDSLAEQIQRAFPQARVVKSLNTVTADLMVDPSLIEGEHAIFLCGNDPDARNEVTTILRDWLGWKQVIDLGDLTGARAMEMYLPLWLRLFGHYGDAKLNIAILR